jgi:glycosyltransferase involved in cell wall biosynthesis
MNRTIVDVTQLIHWSGKITGIPRVMEELAVRFRRDNPDVVFATWVKETKEICEIDLDKTLAQRGHGITYLYGSQTIAPAASGSAPATVATSPSTVLKKGAVRIAKKGIAGASHISPHLASKLENRAKLLRMNRYKKVHFQQGDTLFIPWGEWWDENFIVKLEDAHRSGVRLVQVLHDMAPVVVPQYSNSGNATETFPRYCRRILPIVDLVLSISENSKRDLVNWLKENKLPVPPISLFRLGDNIEIAKPTPSHDPAYAKSGLKGQDFILCVGTIELKKNHMLFYYVYKLARARGVELPKLVIVGRRGWMTEPTFELMTKDPEVADKFVFLLDTSDEELSWIYDRCLFTVLPSFYEGWGIPIAESIARGAPCLCSNTSSMTEIAEGYVEHFSPNSPEECLAGIQKWLDPQELAKARKKVEQYKQFSWDDSFKQVKAHMEETNGK